MKVDSQVVEQVVEEPVVEKPVVEEPVVEEPVVEQVVEKPVVEKPVVEEPVVEEPVVEEPVVEEAVIEDELIVESEQEPVMITLGKLKDLLKEQIPKKNTLDSYCRTIQQVYNRFKIEDMNELLNTKSKTSSILSKTNLRMILPSNASCVPYTNLTKF